MINGFFDACFWAQRVSEETNTLLGDRPTFFFEQVTLAQALKSPPGSAMVLLAFGHTIEWIGHSIEQYKSPHQVRLGIT